MSSLSFHIEGDQLRLSATYRNQYYIQRALGNFVGLAELQRFVAREAGMQQGILTVHACHAEIEKAATLTDVHRLIRDCRDVARPPVRQAAV